MTGNEHYVSKVIAFEKFRNKTTSEFSAPLFLLSSYSYFNYKDELYRSIAGKMKEKIYGR